MIVFKDDCDTKIKDNDAIKFKEFNALGVKTPIARRKLQLGQSQALLEMEYLKNKLIDTEKQLKITKIELNKLKNKIKNGLCPPFLYKGKLATRRRIWFVLPLI